MKTYVVYESMYGNTRVVAEAIGTGLGRLGDVTVAALAEIDPASITDVDLLIVGGPTHVHGMSRPKTREAAVEEANADEAIDLDEDAPGPGLRRWIRKLTPADTDGRQVRVAAFDTRIDKPVLLVGSAAKGIERLLRKRGFAPPLDHESFFVDGMTGPLHDGEVERAQRWGSELANDLTRLRRHSQT